MKASVCVAVACFALAGQAQAQAQAEVPPMLRGAKELEWRAVAELEGASEAALWGDSADVDRAVLVRWTFNTKVPAQVRAQDLHVVVLAGTLTIEVDGQYSELGPGGFASVPKGTAHTIGCGAAGQCTFLMHHGGEAIAGEPEADS